MPRPLKNTLSPGLTDETSWPTCSTMPAPSEPSVFGGDLGVGKRSSRTETSTGFTVAASTRTRIWAGPGSGVGTSSYTRTSGPPYSWMRTAFTAASSGRHRAGTLRESLYPEGDPSYRRCAVRGGAGSPVGAHASPRRGRRTPGGRSGRQRGLRRLPGAAPHTPRDVPGGEADGAEHDDEGQQRGEEQAGDPSAVADHLHRVPERACEGVGRVDGAGLRRALLAQEHGQCAVGRGLAQRFELGAELLDGELHLVDAVLHGQHLVDVGGGVEEAHQALLDGVEVPETRLEIDELRGHVLAGRGDTLHIAERGEALQGDVEGPFRHAHCEGGGGVRAGGGPGLRILEWRHGLSVQRLWFHGPCDVGGVAADGARHDVAAHARRHGGNAVDGGQQGATGDEQREVTGAHQVVRRGRRRRRYGGVDAVAGYGALLRSRSHGSGPGRRRRVVRARCRAERAGRAVQLARSLPATASAEKADHREHGQKPDHDGGDEDLELESASHGLPPARAAEGAAGVP